ncbi:hypothetical protein CSC70_00935 [Pseudoxanthomonas kalamensis DSM 18571]|uniref:TonB-dependent receptor n=1 Tax=Pseudoxanthomonas kalamensis TaxID=289483 RepID=UPI001390B207|nr:TonB-dependent receptor [Pseudoxanthomonas kalamensis]KAF1712129.1 hypothetical protein CSC70_00935 [Pseudoxanthomonas kalamensis DSM 18571]
MKCKNNILSVAVLVSLSLSAQVIAQEASPEAKPDEVQTMDEVTVTSTHQIKSLQKVPASISAINTEQLQALNSSNITDIQYITPGVTYPTDVPGNGASFKIRGIGTQAFNYGTEQTVGVVVDDVLIGLPRDPGATGFNDIERIEVLRGPQGTLFGKNASAGVISIITKNPEIGITGGNVHLALGSRNEQVAQATLNVGVNSISALRLSGYHQQQDGYADNVYHDWSAGDLKNYGIRAKYLIEPSDKLSILIAAEHQSAFSRSPLLPYTVSDDILAAGIFGDHTNDNFSSDDPKSYADEDWYADTKNNGGSVKVDYTFGNATLTSISAYRDLELAQIADIDLLPTNVLNDSITYNDSKQLTQEFRLAGTTTGGRLEYVAGLFYGHTVVEADEIKLGAFDLTGANSWPYLLNLTADGMTNLDATTTSYAVFGSTTYAITDKLSSIVGARYTHDKVDGDFYVTPYPTFNDIPIVPLVPSVPSSGSTSEDNISGKLGLQFESSADVMEYLTIAQGYKGPSIDVLSGATNRIDPETSLSYEAGIKSRFFDRRLTLNASVYIATFKDFQTQVYDDAMAQFHLANADKMKSKGLELETSFRVNEDLTLMANAGYTDAEFGDYVVACPALNSIPCYTDGNGQLLANLKGLAPSGISKYSASLQAVYQHPVGGNLMLDGNLAWNWRSKYSNTVGQDATDTDAYGLLNASIGIGAGDGRWHINLYARNLLDERFRGVSFSTAVLNPGGVSQQLTPQSFRTIGIGFDYNF